MVAVPPLSARGSLQTVLRTVFPEPATTLEELLRFICKRLGDLHQQPLALLGRRHRHPAAPPTRRSIDRAIVYWIFMFSIKDWRLKNNDYGRAIARVCSEVENVFV